MNIPARQLPFSIDISGTRYLFLTCHAPSLGATDGAALPPKNPSSTSTEGAQHACTWICGVEGVSSAVCEPHAQICVRGTACPLASSPPCIPPSLPPSTPLSLTLSRALSVKQRRAAWRQTSLDKLRKRCVLEISLRNLYPVQFFASLLTHKATHRQRICVSPPACADP